MEYCQYWCFENWLYPPWISFSITSHSYIYLVWFYRCLFKFFAGGVYVWYKSVTFATLDYGMSAKSLLLLCRTKSTHVSTCVSSNNTLDTDKIGLERPAQLCVKLNGRIQRHPTDNCSKINSSILCIHCKVSPNINDRTQGISNQLQSLQNLVWFSWSCRDSLCIDQCWILYVWLCID